MLPLFGTILVIGTVLVTLLLAHPQTRQTIGATLSRQQGMAQFLMRSVLYVLIFPILLIALYALLVGVTFGFNLWNPHAPLVTVVWLLVVTSPISFYGLLLWSKGSRGRTLARFSLTLAGIVTSVGDYLIH